MTVIYVLHALKLKRLAKKQSNFKDILLRNKTIDIVWQQYDSF